MSAINLSTIPMNLPSLCIPRVFPNITEARIYKIFGDLKLGEIERIDIVPKTAENGDKYNRVFVHFSRWFNNTHTDEVRGRLLNGKDIKIIYDEPWFWKVSAYRPPAPRPQAAPRPRQQRPKATIELDCEKEPESLANTVARSEDTYRPLQRYTADQSWDDNFRHRPPTRTESGSEAWLGYNIQNSITAPVQPRKIRQHRANLSDFVKPKAKRATSEVTNAIMEEALEDGEVKK